MATHLDFSLKFKMFKALISHFQIYPIDKT